MTKIELVRINGIGQYYGGTQNPGGALLRGAAFNGGNGAAVFTVFLEPAPSDVFSNIGFRCVFRPGSP